MLNRLPSPGPAAMRHGGALAPPVLFGRTEERNELRKALPSGEYPLMDVPMEHPLFHVLYDVKQIPQIPSISFWYGTGGGTSERGRDSATPHVRAVSDRDGHMLIVMTHNTDFGDAFEREGESREYFERFAGAGYAFGIDTLLYSMTH